MRKSWIALLFVCLAAAVFFWKSRDLEVLPPPIVRETIPPGITVTETRNATPPPAAAPGDSQLSGFGLPALPPANDLLLLSRSISNFLIISKRANDFPLSANEEWSAALRGLRPGSEPWISESSGVLDSENRLVDRWGTPLHFHALGGQRWEIRSAGLDRVPWTDDDLIEGFPK